MKRVEMFKRILARFLFQYDFILHFVQNLLFFFCNFWLIYGFKNCCSNCASCLVIILFSQFVETSHRNQHITYAAALACLQIPVKVHSWGDQLFLVFYRFDWFQWPSWLTDLADLWIIYCVCPLNISPFMFINANHHLIDLANDLWVD